MKIVLHRKFILMVMVLILSACGGKEETKEEVLRPVKYQIVGTADAQRIRTFSGAAKAGDEIDLSFRSTGIMSELKIKVGQTVKKGDLVARLDNIEANLAYEKSVSALKAAESSKNTAKTELDRIKALYENQGVSLSDYQNAKNSYQAALDQFESAKRNKGIQQTQISYGFIYAPSDGIIAAKNAEQNENVTAGQVIAVLNAGDDINVEVGLPENVINKVEVGMNVEITFSAIDSKFEGTVTEVSPIVDPNSSTYPVKISINSPTAEIKPGMAANATFDLGGEESASDDSLIIPMESVGEDGNGNFVFIIESGDEATGTVKKHTIEIGELTPEGFRVVSGLDAGQKIATAGLQTLLDGQKVSLQ
ncbi:MAG: efflux RND transporter periplasmic adaptor subunit [Bacteroidota bacterium]